MPFHVTPAVAVAAAGGLAPGSAEVQLRDAFLSAYSGPAEKVSMGIPAMVGSEAALAHTNLMVMHGSELHVQNCSLDAAYFS